MQKTVWIDAGAGDDTVTIAGGNVILSDKAEFFDQRNDTQASAYVLGNPTLDQTATYAGLTIDNPDDVDWFKFVLAHTPGANAKLTLDSQSSQDGLVLSLFDTNTAAATAVGAGAVQLGRDRTDQDTTHDTIETAWALPAVQSIGRVTGLTIDTAADVDMFKIELTPTAARERPMNTSAQPKLRIWLKTMYDPPCTT